MRPILLEAFGMRAASAPVFAGLAAVLAYVYFELRRKELPYSEEDFWGIIAALAFGVFAGSIGGYALISRGGNWHWAVWNGHIAIPGGTFVGAFPGAVLSAAAYCRLRRLRFAPAADVLAAAAPLGLVVMRIGCLLNGCCHGLPTALPWGIVFAGPCSVPLALRGVPLHPTQLYESLGALAIFLIVDRVARPRVKSGALRPGDGLWIGTVLYGLLRFSTEFVRDPDPTAIVFPLPLRLSAVQWACAAAVAAGAAHFLRRRR